ncbi:MAG TPA: phytanoyl-CoA dioxygenase family protein [Steroidobacter sp.]
MLRMVNGWAALRNRQRRVAGATRIAYLRIMDSGPVPALSAADISAFIRDGFVRLDQAFSRQTAEEARAILWRATGCDPEDRSTWTQPVIRLGQFGQPPFREAANTPALHRAFDQLVGQGRWLPIGALGTFPVRFPSVAAPGDDGWHIDVSFGYETPDFMEWRANVNSRGRALLMLFLFSDVDRDDAPTRIRAGSHIDIARQLAPAGEAGLTLRELAADGFATSANRPEVLAVGEAGTVYLCHPFLVHAAQPHRGQNPRFMAQPPLLPREAISLHRDDGQYSPVEQAVLSALD